MPVQSHLIAYSAELILNTFQEVGTKSRRKKKYNPRGDPVFSSLPVHNRMDIVSRRIEKKGESEKTGPSQLGIFVGSSFVGYLECD